MKERSWGGKREGSGRKPGWNHGPCKAVKIPIGLVDEIMRYAHHLDTGGAPFVVNLDADTRKAQGPLTAAPLDTGPLPIQDIDMMQSGNPPPPRGEVLQASSLSSDPVPWIAAVRKKILALPKLETRLMVLRLLIDHRAYTDERLRDHERRPLAEGAGDRVRDQWEQRQQAYRKRIGELDQLFAAFLPEWVEKARAIRPNWGRRETVGARRSYNAILARIDGGPRISRE